MDAESVKSQLGQFGTLSHQVKWGFFLAVFLAQGARGVSWGYDLLAIPPLISYMFADGFSEGVINQSLMSV